MSALVHSSPATTAIPAVALRPDQASPFLVQIQDMWPQSVTSSGFLADGHIGRIERALAAVLRRVYARASTIAVTSPGMARSSRIAGSPPGKMILVPNWADESLVSRR